MKSKTTTFLSCKNKQNLIIFFLILLFSSCLTYKDVSVVKVESVKVNEFNKDGITLTVGLVIDNPNNYKIKIKNSDLDLFVNNKKIGKAKIDNKIVLPKNMKMTQDIVISSKLGDTGAGLFTSLISVIATGGIKCGVKGTIKAGAFGISKTFPVDFSEPVSLSKDILNW